MSSAQEHEEEGVVPTLYSQNGAPGPRLPHLRGRPMSLGQPQSLDSMLPNKQRTRGRSVSPARVCTERRPSPVPEAAEQPEFQPSVRKPSVSQNDYDSNAEEEATDPAIPSRARSPLASPRWPSPRALSPVQSSRFFPASPGSPTPGTPKRTSLRDGTSDPPSPSFSGVLNSTSKPLMRPATRARSSPSLVRVQQTTSWGGGSPPSRSLGSLREERNGSILEQAENGDGKSSGSGSRRESVASASAPLGFGKQFPKGLPKQRRRIMSDSNTSLIGDLDSAENYYSDTSTMIIKGVRGSKARSSLSDVTRSEAGSSTLPRKTSGFSTPLFNVAMFQEKVAEFDKASWEREVDSKIETDIHISMKARKKHKPRAELIDVDLVRGNAFTKVKAAATRSQMNNNFFRVLLFPFYRDWWGSEVDTAGYLLLVGLYSAHAVSILTYFTSRDSMQKTIYGDEPLMPVILLVHIAVIYALVASTQSSAEGRLSTAARAKLRAQEAGKFRERGALHASEDEGGDGSSNEESSGEEERGAVDVDMKVSAMLFDTMGICHKLDLTLPQISHFILCKVDEAPEVKRFFYIGVAASFFAASLPSVYRVYNTGLMRVFFESGGANTPVVFSAALGETWAVTAIIVTSFLSTFLLSFCVFFGLVLAEHVYFQRYLSAKYFTALTSARRARGYGLPHFRLHKVVNIKMWLALRSFLRRKGPQRSIDTIVSSSFVVVLVLVAAVSLKATTGSAGLAVSITDLLVYHWAFSLTLFLLRFMTLGSHINQKFQNTSLLLTEQINLYLRMEQAPHKKDELGICNNVLGLAGKLLGELEGPYKISGIAMSPMLYNITRVVVLSAFSTVLSDALGFKLKIWKAVKVK